MNNRDICAICGAQYGIHQGDTNSCPSGGVEETRPGFSQKWAKTQFVPTSSKTLSFSDPLVSHDIIPLLTKREYFAAKAMAALIDPKTPYAGDISVVAIQATRYADALIEALNK